MFVKIERDQSRFKEIVRGKIRENPPDSPDWRRVSTVSTTPRNASSGGHSFANVKSDKHKCSVCGDKVTLDLQDVDGSSRQITADLVIAALNATNGAWLARMSGSGATCFAIYENTAEAGRAAEKLRRDHPGWWVHAGTLS